MGSETPLKEKPLILSPFEQEPASESERQDLPSSILDLAGKLVEQAFKSQSFFIYWSPSRKRYAQRELNVKKGAADKPRPSDPIVRTEYLLVFSKEKKARTAKDGTPLVCREMSMEEAWGIADLQQCVGLIEIDDLDGSKGSTIRRGQDV